MFFETRSLQRPASPEPAHLPAAVGADVDVDAKVVEEEGGKAAAAPQAGKKNIPRACCQFLRENSRVVLSPQAAGYGAACQEGASPFKKGFFHFF